MPRLSRFTIIKNLKPVLLEYFKNLNQSVFSLAQIQGILLENKEKWKIPKVTTANEFIEVLENEGIIEEIIIDTTQRNITKYIFGEVSPYDIAISLRQGSYLSHYSAIFSHELTEHIPETIYTNLEQSPKYNSDSDEELSQRNIDLAFSRPMRFTNQIATFDLKNKEHKVYLLNGKHQKRLGVEELEAFNLSAPNDVTNIERTLIDIIVRPVYSGGVEIVLEAFKLAKGRYSVDKLLSYLKKMKLIYPYHQLIGFYLDKAGYDKDVLDYLEKFDIKYDFYLTYQMSDKEFSEKWRVYYPKGL